MSKARDYDVWLQRRLQDPKEMAAYLRAHLEGEEEQSIEEWAALLEVAVLACIEVLEEKDK